MHCFFLFTTELIISAIFDSNSNTRKLIKILRNSIFENLILQNLTFASPAKIFASKITCYMVALDICVLGEVLGSPGIHVSCSSE